jgi:serine/threonine-protein kinase
MLNANEIVGGRYKVVKPLGGGGMKLVYLAEDLRLASRQCALAEMVDSFTSPDMQQQAVAAFQREADMLAQLSNDHIPRVFDRFSEQNHHYLVMEYIAGNTLEETLRSSNGKLDEARVIDIALQVLDTLSYLHGLVPAVVYRDLKPSNVMLTPAGQAKLIDFGIARFFQPHSAATMIGTQGYAPPEQYRGKPETRSDIYALGATMHHALSGRDPTSEPPFSFPPLLKVAPGVDPRLAGLVDSALAYDLERRMPNAEEFKRRLLEIRTGVAGDGATYATARGATPPSVAAVDTASAEAQSTFGPTILSNPIEILCPRCARYVPADSRFCSFCASDLRRAPGELAGASQAETASLPDRLTADPGANRHSRHERRRRRRRPLRTAIIVAAVLALLFGLRVLSALRNANTPPEEGIVPPDSPEAAEPQHLTTREAALRQFLDLQGYHSVHFRIVDGTTVELWGTVPTRFDRVAVQSMAATVTGLFSLEDHMKVEHDDFFGDPG